MADGIGKNSKRGNPAGREESKSTDQAGKSLGCGRRAEKPRWKVHGIKYDLGGHGAMEELIVGAMQSHLRGFEPWHNITCNLKKRISLAVAYKMEFRGHDHQCKPVRELLW